MHGGRLAKFRYRFPASLLAAFLALAATGFYPGQPAIAAPTGGTETPVFADGFELTVRINAPENGESRLVSTPVAFVGSASEPATLVWTSSLDGQIGTGNSFMAMLSVGTHTITLTATNAGGAVASASITLRMDS